MKNRLRYLLLTGIFYFMLAARAFADDDDHHFFQGGGSAGPMSGTDFTFAVSVYALAFAGGLAVLLFAHGWIAGLGLALHSIPVLAGLLSWLIFVPGAVVPALLWYTLSELTLGAYNGEIGYGLCSSVLFLLLASVLYHYLLYLLLGLFSSRVWGRTLCRLYCLPGLCALALAVWRGSPLFVLFFLVICLVPALLAWKIHAKRSAGLTAKKSGQGKAAAH